MSWWTGLRDTAVNVGTLGLYNPRQERHKEAEARRASAPTAQPDVRQAINEQMQAYKNETELTKKEIAAKQNEENYERRRIQEKQIRTLRRHFRAASILGNQAGSEPGMTEKLGA